MLALSIAYTQAIWRGSPGVVAWFPTWSTPEAKARAVPRSIEALASRAGWGVDTDPASAGVDARSAALVAGVATSLIQPTTPFVDSTATGYDLLIGGFLGWC